MARIPSSILRIKVPGETFAAALPQLRKAYCGTIAYEIEHLSDHQKRLWLRGVIESGRFREPIPDERRIATARAAGRASTPSSASCAAPTSARRRFSIEGVDALVPITDHVIELSAAEGTGEVVMGMAHRGRLAFITHVVGRPPESILAEFEGHMAFESGEEDARETAGDVKYHLGAEGTYITRSGRPVTVKLAANPSHLEQVNAVAEGHTRALPDLPHVARGAATTRPRAVPVLIHGDAAFTGQGVVAETLNLPALRGYTHRRHRPHHRQQPDRLHDRPVRLALARYYASDLAKGFDIPIIHVNADDAEACIAAARLAVGLPPALSAGRADRPDRLPPLGPQRAATSRPTPSR